MDTTVFDTTPFAYVGNNKHYKDLSDEEKAKLKAEDKSEKHVEVTEPIKKEALPSSEEVEESSASVIGQMLPQVGLTETTEPSMDEMFGDIAEEETELLKEALSDELYGADMYFEAFGFIEKIKNKFKKSDTDSVNNINHDKLMKVAKAYTSLRLANFRVKIAVVSNPKIKGTSEYKTLQKKVIVAEKEYRKLKKDLNKDELEALKQHIAVIDSDFDKKIVIFIKDIKDSQKAAIKKEYAEFISDENILDIITESYKYDNDELYTEGANWDIHKKYRTDLKVFKANLKDAKKYLKNHSYDEAREQIKKAIGIMEECKKAAIEEIEKIDQDSALTAICGFIFRNITIVCRDMLLLITVYPIALVKNLIDIITDIMNSINSIKKKGNFTASDINRYVNFVKNDYDRMIRVLEHFLAKVDESEKKHKIDEKEVVKDVVKEATEVNTECGTTDIVTEKNLDPEMKPLIDKLHQKGYKTTASSSGHKNVIIKKDGDRDNVANEHYYGDARLVFADKYNFGKAPTYWYWKKVDNGDKVDYLDIKQVKADEWPDPSEKFANWKKNYMKSLSDWIESLPDISNEKKDVVDEACETESNTDLDTAIDTMFESVMSDIEFDILDI